MTVSEKYLSPVRACTKMTTETYPLDSITWSSSVTDKSTFSGMMEIEAILECTEKLMGD